jgi:hypothetical protein
MMRPSLDPILPMEGSMTLFDEREHAAELMFVHDAEMRFRALARRNKLLGLWAADRMGLSGAHAEMYAHDLVEKVVAADQDEALVGKLQADLIQHGAVVSEHQLRRMIGQFMVEAVNQINAEPDLPAGGGPR